MLEKHRQININNRYEIANRGDCLQIISKHPNNIWSMSVVATETLRDHKTVKDSSKIEIYFDGIDEMTHTITSEDIPGMNSLDNNFLEEFADRYAARFQSLGSVSDSDEAFEKVFLDICEMRMTNNSTERDEWLRTWKALKNK